MIAAGANMGAGTARIRLSSSAAVVLSVPIGAMVYLLSWQVRLWEASVVLTALASLPLALVAHWLWRTRRPVLWILAPYLLFHVLTAGSALLIESGAYIPELDTWGEPNGTAARLCIEAALLFLVAGWSAGRQRYPAKGMLTTRRSALAEVLFIALAAATLVVPTINLITLGAPLFLGLDRVAFYREAGSLHLRFVILFVAAVPSLSLLALGSRRTSLTWISVVLIVAGLATMILSGEKFTGLILTVYAASVPALLRGHSAALKRLGVASMAVLAASIGLIAYHYSAIYEVVNVGEFAIGRLAAQAEVPWAIDRIVHARDPFDPLALVLRELVPSDTRAQGIESLMLAIAPTDFVVPLIETGTRFTMGFPAVLKLHLGVMAIVLLPPLAMIVGLFVRLLLFCMARDRLFALWMAMNLVGFGSLLDHLLLAGNLYQLAYTEPTRFAWLLLLLTGLFVPLRRKGSNEPT